jgi:hypothetical protein
MLDIVDHNSGGFLARSPRTRTYSFIAESDLRENGLTLPGARSFLQKQNSEIFQRQDNRLRMACVKNNLPGMPTITNR